MRRRLGQRYEIGEVIGSGATSTVHLGRLLGTAGFTKLIAIKRLHPHLASDATLRAILVDEARLVSRISHPNVVAVLDVAEEDGELFLVLEYARGATLSELLGKGRLPAPIAVTVMRDALAGLHAAHHARDGRGEPLGLVHRDVSPRNVIATTDGVGKILDFGIAKARARLSTTGEGQVRGSLPYMAPEQLRDEPLTPRTDVYGASVVLWEALTGRRLFGGESEAAVVQKILDHVVPPPSTICADLPSSIDAVVMRGLASAPAERFASGLEMALALEDSLSPATSAEVAAWVTEVKEGELSAREGRIAEAEAGAIAVAPGPAETRAQTTAETKPETREKRRVLVAVLVTATVITCGAAGAFALAGRRSASAPVSPTMASTVVPRVESPPPTASFTSTVAPPSTAPPSTATTTPPTPTKAPGRSPTRGHAGTSPAPRPPASAPPPAATKPADCPPYHVDDAGVRRFNRECLQ